MRPAHAAAEPSPYNDSMASDSRGITLLGMSWRNLSRQPVRTLLTAVGVGVGVVAIVAFTSLVRGLWAATDAAIHLGEGDMIVFEAGVAADLFSTLDEEETRNALLAIPEIERASGWLLHVLPVEGHPFMVMFGVRRDEVRAHYPRLVAGRSRT